jgi:hypothetical protein
MTRYFAVVQRAIAISQRAPGKRKFGLRIFQSLSGGRIDALALR